MPWILASVQGTQSQISMIRAKAVFLWTHGNLRTESILPASAIRASATAHLSTRRDGKLNYRVFVVIAAACCYRYYCNKFK